MLLEEIVVTSERVTNERGRLAKIRELGEVLGRMQPEEIPIGVAYLSGELPQGRIGIGWAGIRDAQPETGAAEATLTLADVRYGDAAHCR